MNCYLYRLDPRDQFQARVGQKVNNNIYFHIFYLYYTFTDIQTPKINVQIYIDRRQQK